MVMNLFLPTPDVSCLQEDKGKDEMPEKHRTQRAYTEVRMSYLQLMVQLLGKVSPLQLLENTQEKEVGKKGVHYRQRMCNCTQETTNSLSDQMKSLNCWLFRANWQFHVVQTTSFLWLQKRELRWNGKRWIVSRVGLDVDRAPPHTLSWVIPVVWIIKYWSESLVFNQVPISFFISCDNNKTTTMKQPSLWHWQRSSWLSESIAPFEKHQERIWTQKSMETSHREYRVCPDTKRILRDQTWMQNHMALSWESGRCVRRKDGYRNSKEEDGMAWKLDHESLVREWKGEWKEGFHLNSTITVRGREIKRSSQGLGTVNSTMSGRKLMECSCLRQGGMVIIGSVSVQCTPGCLLQSFHSYPAHHRRETNCKQLGFHID